MFSLLIRNLGAAFRKPRDPGQAITEPSSGTQEETARNQALLALGNNDVLKCIEILKPVIPRAVEAETHSLYIWCLISTGNFVEALSALEFALKQYPRTERLLKLEAILYEHLGDRRNTYAAHVRLMLAAREPSAQLLVGVLRAFIQSNPDPKSPVPIVIQRAVALFLRLEAEESSSVCFEFAEWLFSIKPLQPEALNILKRHLPEADFKTMNWITSSKLSGDWPTTVGTPSAGTKSYLELSNAGVFPGLQWTPWLLEKNVLIDDFITRRLRTRRESGESPLMLNNSTQAVLHMPPQPIRQIAEPTVLIGSTDNYYHFVIEHVGRLASLDGLTQQRDQLFWLLPETLADYQKEYLQLLGIPEDRWLQVSPAQMLRFDHLIAPLPLARGGKDISPRIPRWLRQTLCPTPPKNGGKRLYLSRKLAPRRAVLNEADVLARLAHAGFECVYPETLSVPAQIALFSEASAIIAPSGAALANMVFMPPGGTVGVFYTKYTLSSPNPLYFDVLAQACGHAFQSIECTTASFRTERAMDADFQVVLETLDNYLNKLLATAS